MSLEHMSSRELALTNYRAAEADVSKDGSSELQTVAAQAEDPVWVGGLLQVFAQPDGSDGTAMPSAASMYDEWRRTLGHTDWLEWLAAEDVQELLLQWRELHAMQDWLNAFAGRADDVRCAGDRTAAPCRDGAGTDRLRTACATRRERSGSRRWRDMHERIDVLTARDARTHRRRGCWRWPTPDEAKLLEQSRGQSARADADARRRNSGHELLARIDYLEGTVFWNLVDERHDALARRGETSARDRRACSRRSTRS